VVGQRRQHEVVGAQHVPLQAVRPQRVQVGLEHAADQVLGQGGRVQALGQLPDRRDQGRAEELGREDPVQEELPADRDVERLGQQLREVVHRDAALAQRLGEDVMLLLGPPGPHHVVEQQLADVLRGQPGQLQARPVHDDLAELSHLGLDAERHDWTSCAVPVPVPATGAGRSRRPLRKA
jgi:hypothetical protein